MSINTTDKLRPLDDWLQQFDNSTTCAINYLKRIYGDDLNVIEHKRSVIVSLLKSYRIQFNNKPVIITRAPGRVNLMGRHIDHQGGCGNVMAISKDVYCIVGPRQDRWVELSNINSQKFPSQKFLIDDTIASYNGDWQNYVTSNFVQKFVNDSKENWTKYIKAAIARFQTKYFHQLLNGMNILIASDIPIAAGLSSSSALLVAVSEGIVEINRLQIKAEEFAELCAEAEWYVGTRGGAGDHAAMKFSKNGEIINIGYFPLNIIGSTKFPTDHLIVICNSKIKAKKAENAREIFNHRVACYHIGREFFKLEFPQFVSRINYLRDINIENLGVDYFSLLKMIKRLPQSIDYQQVIHWLPPEIANAYLSNQSNLFKKFPIRGVIMFGLSEIERSRNTLNLLKAGKIDEFGNWMNISHDGDRVKHFQNSGKGFLYHKDYTDETMDKLIANAEKSNIINELALQPGAYRCSISEIDRMVDISLSVKGVKGAQISGAGLGGCIMVLIEKNAVNRLKETLIQRYYKPLNLMPAIFCCSPIEGSGVICF